MPRKKPVAMGEIDEAELTLRLLEIGCKIKRPKGKAARDCMAEIDGKVARGEVPAYIVADFRAMARASVEYFGECLRAAKPIN